MGEVGDCKMLWYHSSTKAIVENAMGTLRAHHKNGNFVIHLCIVFHLLFFCVPYKIARNGKMHRKHTKGTTKQNRRLVLR